MTADRRRQLAGLLLLAVVLANALAWGGVPGVPGSPSGVTAAAYVYEKDQHVVPAPVRAALNKLNRQGIRATVYEQDTTDGTGEIPEQYKVPLTAAREAGLPALVVMAGDRVVRTVSKPTTEEAVLGAAQ